MKKIIALLLAVSMLCILPSCVETPKQTAKEIQPVDFANYQDSEDIPDWQGEKLELVKWEQASNPNSSTNKTVIVTDDPVSKELERVTGITYSVDESFDNGGDNFDAVVAKLIATDEFPHIAEGIPDPSSLIQGGYLWNVEPYLEKYAPTIYRMFGPDSKTLYGDQWRYQMETYGGIYELGIGDTAQAVKDLKEKDGSVDFTENEISALMGNGSSAYPYFYMRDDILKQLYPEAHTVAELQEIYKQNGKFTQEEILDVPIESPQDFIDLLYKIKDLNLMDGKEKVYATFTHTGMDNWPVLVMLGSMFRYASATPGSNVNYFSYYDMKDDTLKATFKQPWFKDVLKMWNKMIRDGVASEEALIDTNSIFKEKLNNGRYIVCYGSYYPTEESLNGKYAYRKVFARYKVDMDSYLYNAYDYTSWNRYTFFKGALSEQQLIQVLQMLEFMATEAGQKLMNWGPKSAGYYVEESDGKLRFVDEEVQQLITDGKSFNTDKVKQMGLGATWPTKIKLSTTKYVRNIMYAEELGSWETAFDAALIEEQEFTPSYAPTIYGAETLVKIPEAKRFWDARNGFEEALVKVFAAQSDEEFEDLYQKMVDYAELNGLTDETFAQYNEFYKNELNALYMPYIRERQANLQ